MKNQGMRGAIDYWLDFLGLVAIALVGTGVLVAVMLLIAPWAGLALVLLAIAADMTWSGWGR